MDINTSFHHPSQECQCICHTCRHPFCWECGEHSGHETEDLRELLEREEKELIPPSSIPFLLPQLEDAEEETKREEKRDDREYYKIKKMIDVEESIHEKGNEAVYEGERDSTDAIISYLLEAEEELKHTLPRGHVEKLGNIST